MPRPAAAAAATAAAAAPTPPDTALPAAVDPVAVAAARTEVPDAAAAAAADRAAAIVASWMPAPPGPLRTRRALKPASTDAPCSCRAAAASTLPVASACGVGAGERAEKTERVLHGAHCAGTKQDSNDQHGHEACMKSLIGKLRGAHIDPLQHMLQQATAVHG